MKKVSRRVLAAVAVAIIVGVAITSGVMAAAPVGENCPNDGLCLYGGEGPADGTGIKARTQENRARSNQNQSNNQFFADGNRNARQHVNAYRHGHGATTD